MGPPHYDHVHYDHGHCDHIHSAHKYCANVHSAHGHSDHSHSDHGHYANKFWTKKKTLKKLFIMTTVILPIANGILDLEKKLWKKKCSLCPRSFCPQPRGIRDLKIFHKKVGQCHIRKLRSTSCQTKAYKKNTKKLRPTNPNLCRLILKLKLHVPELRTKTSNWGRHKCKCRSTRSTFKSKHCKTELNIWLNWGRQILPVIKHGGLGFRYIINISHNSTKLLI